MNRSTSSRRAGLVAIAIAIGLVAVIAMGAAGVLGRPASSPVPSPSSSPTDRPSPVPTVPASDAPPATPSPKPSAQPSSPPEEGIVLDIATGHKVSVVIDDRTGMLTGAKSGRAGDGMSVRWHDMLVENVDAETVRLTWVGLPLDDEVAMSISRTGDGYRIAVVQVGPPVNSDAVGFDRVLVLTFDAPVSASEIEATIEDRGV